MPHRSLPRVARCPRCGASTRLDPGNPWRPFCSRRCKLIDLDDWLSGRYALPVPESSPPSPDDEDAQQRQ
ncbi:MAG: DNA gyrase inhibitor YacG [Nevskia sp.]|nr:DNA gyrase inhibitor YacG [Nevskia sp.]